MATLLIKTKENDKKKKHKLETDYEEDDSTSDVGGKLHIAVEVKTEPGQPSSFEGMSLDVLAQVASDRLEIVEHKVSKKKAPKRAVQNMDKLDLEQIRNLSDKLIVSLFSDMTCDEIKKMYTFKCYLMPKTCEHQITVYGNEMKAKQSMKNHLRTHIDALENVKMEDAASEELSFEPVPARKKRLAAQYSREQKMRKGKKTAVCMMRKGVYPSPRLKRGRPPSFPQTLQDYVELGMDIHGESPDAEKREREAITLKTEKSPSPKEDIFPITVKHEINTEKIVQESLLNDNVFIKQREEGEKQAQEIRKQLARGTLEKIHPGVSSEMLNSNLNKEQLIIDLMQKEQPFQDHNYTSILGRKSQLESIKTEEEVKTEKSDDTAFNTSRVSGRRTGDESTTVLLENGQTPQMAIDTFTTQPVALSGSNFEVQMVSPTSLSVPILRLPCDAVKMEGNNTPEEMVLQELTRLAEKMTQKNLPLSQFITREANEKPVETSSNVQNLIPVVDGEKQARLAADEANLMDCDDDDPITPEANPHRRGRKGLENSSGEWERKAALKCIRELRIRKKDDSTLVCKICKDKTFTATATLLYHYRSHAGIKPFVCLICNTTFTRQHSLNYHMLIHNNQSRFTCKECGRKFRHPSHFKEHMRRHTGETPYHCTDCPLRFKTRNTYKRHLRTRHDKLLTSCGIQKMTVEEVALNKAMQQYAMDHQQHSYQQSEDCSEQDQSTDNTDSDPPTGFKAIAPKTEPGFTKSVSTNSALAQALLAPIQTPRSQGTINSSSTSRSSNAIANLVPSSLISSSSSVSNSSGAVSSVGADNGGKNINPAALGLQPSVVVSCTTAAPPAAMAAAANVANISFLQQAAPLPCFAPLNAGQPLMLGHPAQLQQFVMALPPPGTPQHQQQNAAATTFIAAAQAGTAQPVTMAAAALGNTSNPSLMTSSSQQQQPSLIMAAPQQPLVALTTGHGAAGQQNVLMATQLHQPILTAPLQAVQPYAVAAPPNVVQTSNAGTLTLAAAPQGAAQFMGMGMTCITNQANFLQPFQAAFQNATLQVNNTTQQAASAVQLDTLASTTKHHLHQHSNTPGGGGVGGQPNQIQVQIPADQISALQFAHGHNGTLQIVAGGGQSAVPAFRSMSALNNAAVTNKQLMQPPLSLTSSTKDLPNSNIQPSLIQPAAIISDTGKMDHLRSSQLHTVVPMTVGQIGSYLSCTDNITTTTFSLAAAKQHSLPSHHQAVVAPSLATATTTNFETVSSPHNDGTYSLATGYGDLNDNNVKQQEQQQQPDTPAARTLLKFCSQVVNQMGQVIPTSNNVT